MKNEPLARASLDLPDGRTLDFDIRRSGARNVYFRMCPRNGLVVTAPRRMGRATLLRLVARKAKWIANRLSEFEAVRHLADHEAAVRPESLDLPALAESWKVEYRATGRAGAAALADRPGCIAVSGGVEDIEACQGALRRWLARRAASAFSPWLARLSEASGLQYADLSIRSQRARWGSCTVGGRISLNCKLLFLPRELVNYVMVHELCHLLESNHSHRFWAHVRRIEPGSDALRRQMRQAWKWVPAWAH